jgi:hypothetical protein
VLLLGAVLTVGTFVYLYLQLRFVFFAQRTEATVTRKQADEAILTFTDVEGLPHSVRTAPREGFTQGERVPLRYLLSNPEVVRLEGDVQSAWQWGALWCLLGLGLLGFGVLLMWGQRPDRSGGWRGRPGEW